MTVLAAKLESMGLVLPKAVRPPPGIVLPFRLVRVRGRLALRSPELRSPGLPSPRKVALRTDSVIDIPALSDDALRSEEDGEEEAG